MEQGSSGRRVVRRLLDRGDDVVMLARDAAKAAEVSQRGARVVVGDLADVDAFAKELCGCDVVYHVGARVRVAR